MKQRQLILFVKAPVLGRVKTRLAGDIGAVEATRLYRDLTHRLLRRVGVDRRWRTVLAVTPDDAASLAFWPKGLQRRKQGQRDLGVRMRLALTGADGPAIIIGSDIPGITKKHIADAFQKLMSHDVVFGPAADGGYWLVGVRHPAAAHTMFHQVRWSSPHALADTVAGLPKHRRVAYVKQLRDIDTVEDYFSVSRGISSTKLQGR